MTFQHSWESHGFMFKNGSYQMFFHLLNFLKWKSTFILLYGSSPQLGEGTCVENHTLRLGERKKQYENYPLSYFKNMSIQNRNCHKNALDKRRSPPKQVSLGDDLMMNKEAFFLGLLSLCGVNHI